MDFLLGLKLNLLVKYRLPQTIPSELITFNAHSSVALSHDLSPDYSHDHVTLLASRSHLTCPMIT
jgi:hypothetical protein